MLSSFKSMTKINKLIIGAIFFGALLFVPGKIEAQASISDSPTTNAKIKLARFNYKAKPSDTLTYMVRKSITLLDENDKSNDLSKEAIIYTETNVVNELGSRWLDVDENVSVPLGVVDKYIKKSKDLSADQIMAWRQYIYNVDFDLASIKPTNNVTQQVKQLEEETTKVDKKPTQAKEDDSKKTSKKSDDNSNTLWWILGAGGIVAAWYVLFKRDSEPSNN